MVHRGPPGPANPVSPHVWSRRRWTTRGHTASGRAAVPAMCGSTCNATSRHRTCSHDLPQDAREVLDFWFGAPGTPEHGTPCPEWFRKDRIRRSDRAALRGTRRRALDGAFREWDAAGADATLARILVLDQFPRATSSAAGALVRRRPARAAGGAGDGCRRARPRAAAGAALVRLPALRARRDLPLRTKRCACSPALVQAEPTLSGVMDYVHRHHATSSCASAAFRTATSGWPHVDAGGLAFLQEPGSARAWGAALAPHPAHDRAVTRAGRHAGARGCTLR